MIHVVIFLYLFIKSTSRYKKYFNNKFLLIDHIKSTDDRLIKKLNNLNLSEYDFNNIYRLLKLMLTIDPKKRITIDKLLSDSWLFN